MPLYIDEFPGREITIDNSKNLYFGGTAYLGLQTNEAFKTLYIKNIEKYGTNYGASRKSNIQLSIYEKAETHLANLVKSKSCITLSSGFLAGQLISQYFNNKKHKLFYAPVSHTALSQKKRKTYSSYSDLNLALINHLKTKKTTPVVFLDTVSFNTSNYPHYENLKLLPLNKIIVIADDSHGIGVVGTDGQGSYQKLIALKPKELVVCCSLGKGFGVQGGAIFSTNSIIKNLKKTSFFGGASPVSPAALATFLEASPIYTSQREKLNSAIKYFVNNVKPLHYFQFTDNHPCFRTNHETIAKYLEANNVIITSFNYPNNDSKLMNNIVLSASHLKEDLEELVSLLNMYL